jgi:hypothetical protein
VFYSFCATRSLIPSKHWHGIRQSETNWADGVAFITQCPILQNRSFLHQFRALGQTGTYWCVLSISTQEEYQCLLYDRYHSHFSTQQCECSLLSLRSLPNTVRPGDGLRGPLVIYDPEDPHKDLYDVDDGKHLRFNVRIAH